MNETLLFVEHARTRFSGVGSFGGSNWADVGSLISYFVSTSMKKNCFEAIPLTLA